MTNDYVNYMKTFVELMEMEEIQNDRLENYVKTINNKCIITDIDTYSYNKNSDKNSLNIMHLNIQSCMSKIDHLKIF